MPCDRRIIVLGSTGSIGVNTLEVVTHLGTLGHAHQIVGLAVGANVGRLAEQVMQYKPELVAIADQSAAAHWDSGVPALVGPDASAALVDQVARPGDLIVAAIVGAAGLEAGSYGD